MPAFPQQSQFSSPLQPLPPFSTDENLDHEVDDSDIDLLSVKHQDEDRQSHRRSDVSMTRTISPPPESILSGDFQYVPHRNRPPFRTPSSIKALQLSPSPISSPRLTKSGGDRKWSIRAVRRSDALSESESTDATPEGARDDLSSINGHETHSSPAFRRMMEARRMDDLERHLREASSRTGTPLSMHMAHNDKVSPLVLLHVSILPSQETVYPLSVLQAAKTPSWVVDNMLLLREKLCSAVLARGILIPHPGEEYDILEERLLEALELCAPRVLGCGHFYDGEGTYDCDYDCEEDGLDGLTETGMDAAPRAICDYAHEDVKESDVKTSHDCEDEDLCQTCAQPMRLPNRGTGYGKRRWDVRFYASNGLMRAGAWSAAWREMERVDVEIQPWMPQDVRMALDGAMENEIKAQAREAADKQREVEDIKANMEQHVHELERQLQKSQEEVTTMLREAASSRTNPVNEFSIHSKVLANPTNNVTHSFGKDIPLDHLLKNYLYVLAQDKRNVVMAGMMFFIVLLLSISLAGRGNNHTTQLGSYNVIPSNIPPIGSHITALPIQKSVGILDPVQSADLSITGSIAHATATQTRNMLGSTASPAKAGS